MGSPVMEGLGWHVFVVFFPFFVMGYCIMLWMDGGVVGWWGWMDETVLGNTVSLSRVGCRGGQVPPA